MYALSDITRSTNTQPGRTPLYRLYPGVDHDLETQPGSANPCSYILISSSNAYYSPHTHTGLTTHLIRRGSLTISYPEDNSVSNSGQAKKETYGVGERIDVPAGKLHEVWIGDEGCEYVIGE